MADHVPADIIAYTDQMTAELRDLARLANLHRAQGCEVDIAPCAGTEVVEAVEDMDCLHRIILLALAVAELSALGYGEAIDPLDLTEAARAALDQDGGGGDA